jgi:hypothetical protein
MFDVLLFAALGLALLFWAASLAEYSRKSFSDVRFMRDVVKLMSSTVFLRIIGVVWIALAIALLVYDF